METVIPIQTRRRARRYDDKRGCYVYDISFQTKSTLTKRTIKVAEAFGIGIDLEKEHILYKDFELKLAEGDIVYINGDSGSGKSVLLRAIEEDLGDQAINIDDIDTASNRPLIDTVGTTFREGLMLLSKVGLNDAFLFLRRYDQLSDGQKYRYSIARMIDSGKRFWLADEFCSTLDRTTAKIVAYNIQKLARRSSATLIVATTHTDLEKDLNPSILIRKGWGEDIQIEYKHNMETPSCTVTREITIREASKEDYNRLSHLHYRDHRVPVSHKFFAMERLGELIGVIAYCYPPINTMGRKQAVGYTPRLKELNRDWTIISRVIIHPKYRTIGLGIRLVKETLPLCGRCHVELIAVMAQYNPFAEKAGMKLILRSEPHPSVQRAIERLRKAGFNPTLIASEAYNLRLLKEISEDQVDEIREILYSVNPQYYKRLSRKGKPYVRKAEMKKWLRNQPKKSLARSIKILSILNESKAYLYWSRDWLQEETEQEGGRGSR